MEEQKVQIKIFTTWEMSMEELEVAVNDFLETLGADQVCSIEHPYNSTGSLVVIITYKK